MRRADILALILSLLAFCAALLVAERVFENMPHIEDEMAYVWQAQAMARGKLSLPTPPESKAFLVPFVVDYNGQRFGKYPLGWPAMLSLGEMLHSRILVNPLLAALAVWLTYRLGKKLFSDLVGLLAAVLTLTSPFFLMNSGTLLSHPFGLFLSTGFALAWLDAWEINLNQPRTYPDWLPLLIAAGCLGLLTFTRPLTAAAVALPFVFHGSYLLLRGDRRTRLRLLLFCGVVLALASLILIWQYAVTADPLLNPYTLWWPYDKIGFGPGFGHMPNGHSWYLAKINTRFSLWVGWHDLFGWGGYSWIFLPFGVLALLVQRNWKGMLVSLVCPALVLLYLAYWIGSSLFGPRYFYEGLYSPTLLSALGIAFLAGWPNRPDARWQPFSGWKKARPLIVAAGVFFLVSLNLLYYVPARLGGMHGLYGISCQRLEPFLTPQAQVLTPALVIVHAGRWTEYGGLLELQNPFLDTPFIFVMYNGERIKTTLAESFPGRNLIEYYPDTPTVLYLLNQENTQ
jgi:4-amino-4-deoxy-L-arabinose transferase-like glycosyltransferase